MADPPPLSESDDDTTPRWVKVFGLIAIVLVLLFVILHLTGGGFHGHTLSGAGPGDPTPSSSVTEHGVHQT